DSQNDTADAELRVIQRTADRQIDVDDAVAILHQRDGQKHGQLGGVGTFHFLAEGQLVEDDFVFGAELAIVELVLDVEGELAFLDAVTDVPDRIGRHGAQFDFLGVGDNVEKQLLGQRIDLAFNLDRSGIVEARLQIEISRRLRFELRDRALNAGQVGVVVGLDEKIAKVDVAVFQIDFTDADGFWRAIGGGSGGRFGLFAG